MVANVPCAPHKVVSLPKSGWVKEFKGLWPKLAVVVDGGPIGDQSRLGSTVVDLSVLGKYRIIRPGW